MRKRLGTLFLFSVGPALALLAGMVSVPADASVLLDPASQPRFVNPLPIPGEIDATAGGTFEITMKQCGTQWLGLYDPDSGDPLLTTVWGYEPAGGACTFPGPTVEARSDVAVDFLWRNGLVDGAGDPLPHLLPVDASLHWADPLGVGYPQAFEGPVPLVTHLHGGHTESASDGLPEAWFTPDFMHRGRYWKKALYHYDNDQEGGTLWYHDHALGITRLNVYAGLAGFYLLRDGNEDWLVANRFLPDREHEVELVFQDRMFTEDGELYYPSEPGGPGQPAPSVLPEFFGDHILVNGMAWPVLDVEPRKYRFRMLNGSDSRFYKMWLAPQNPTKRRAFGPPFNQIGTDVGLMDAPVTLEKVTFGPGERLDVVIDFSGFEGMTLILRNNARSPFPKGDVVDPQNTGQLMAFRVGAVPTPDPVMLPATLRPAPFEIPVSPGVTVRKLVLFEGEDQYGRLRPQLGILDPDSPLNGSLLWDEEITENPMLDDVEIWEIYNATEDAHPIHQHLVAFQVLNRQKFKGDLVLAGTDPIDGGTKLVLENVRVIGKTKGPESNELGPKDTAQMFPGEVTRVAAIYDREGRYVWHCHILSHEDHEMMRPYCVGPIDNCVVPE